MDGHEEIFIDPEHALKRPSEVILKFAFNEDAELGLIVSYQDIGDDVIFTGINLIECKMWLCKSPLVIKGSPDPESIQAISKLITSLNNNNRPPLIQGYTYEHTPEGPSKRSFSTDSLSSLFQILKDLHGPQLDEEGVNKDYFGSPDFTPPKGTKFDFGMDAFLEAFDIAQDDPEFNSNDTDRDDNDDITNFLDEDEDDDPDGLG